MSKAVLFFADGTEECEALLVADLLRRARVEVIIASAMGRRAENDYKVNLKTEIMIEDLYDKVNAILAKQSALEKKLQEQEDQTKS